jgi:alpha/beta superfamily hydrolase
MRRGAIVGFSFGAWTAGMVATSSEQNFLENFWGTAMLYAVSELYSPKGPSVV